MYAVAYSPIPMYVRICAYVCAPPPNKMKENMVKNYSYVWLWDWLLAAPQAQLSVARPAAVTLLEVHFCREDNVWL